LLSHVVAFGRGGGGERNHMASSFSANTRRERERREAEKVIFCVMISGFEDNLTASLFARKAFDGINKSVW
jgi:hypothetical protein